MKKTNYYLCSDKIKGKRKRLHVYVWEKHNGKVPEGYHVHHKDMNKFNNNITNLELLPHSEHMAFHNKHLTDCQKQNRRKHLLNKAIPAAKKWHKSEEGRKWHIKHGVKVAEEQHKRKAMLVCEQCGKEYETFEFKKRRSRFCSNKCKSAWRRKVKLDDVERVCLKCGKTFMTNKYSKTVYCSKSCAKKK